MLLVTSLTKYSDMARFGADCIVLLFAVTVSGCSNVLCRELGCDLWSAMRDLNQGRGMGGDLLRGKEGGLWVLLREEAAGWLLEKQVDTAGSDVACVGRH